MMKLVAYQSSIKNDQKHQFPNINVIITRQCIPIEQQLYCQDKVKIKYQNVLRFQTLYFYFAHFFLISVFRYLIKLFYVFMFLQVFIINFTYFQSFLNFIIYKFETSYFIFINCNYTKNSQSLVQNQMTSTINIKQLDQSNWVCYQFDNNTFYYGQVGYLDQSGIVLPKDNVQASSNPKNKLVKHGVGVYLTNVSQQGVPQIKYQGNWDRDQKSGKGTIKYADGTYYQGNFHQGHYHGSGKMVWPNSDQYQGNWKRSKMDGSGIFKQSSGFVLKGMFKNNYYIDENVLRNPFLNEKQYAVFKKERKEILKQKQKQQKLKHGFTIKVKQQEQQKLKQNIQKSTSHNRVPLILSTKTTQYNLESLIKSLESLYQNTKINIFDLRKLYTLSGQQKWKYRKQVHEQYRNSLQKGQIFILSLDQSQVQFNQMFYPDIKQFYQSNGFNSSSWSVQQIKLPQIRKKILGNNSQISNNYKFIVWTKYKIDQNLNQQNIRQKLQLRFQKIIPFIKIDSIVINQ